MYGDPRRLKQVFINLLANAVKYTKKGGVNVIVKILHGKVNYLHVTVSDSGVGITKDDLERIFEPFTQATGRITSYNVCYTKLLRASDGWVRNTSAHKGR